MMLLDHAIVHLQKRLPQAVVTHEDLELENNAIGAQPKQLRVLAVHDPRTCVIQRALATKSLGSHNEVGYLAANSANLFEHLMSGSVYVAGNPEMIPGHDVNSSQMQVAPRVILFTDRSLVSAASVLNEFKAHDILLDLVEGLEAYSSVLISYGGPDLDLARALYSELRRRYIPVWLFEEDAVPGSKLHRTMHEQAFTRDKMLLLCSKSSLNRPGVLNEIERILEREAMEGGTSRLIPIAIDDFVYSEWSPERQDLATQVRTRVIGKLRSPNPLEVATDPLLNRLAESFRKD